MQQKKEISLKTLKKFIMSHLVTVIHGYIPEKQLVHLNLACAEIFRFQTLIFYFPKTKLMEKHNQI